MLAEFFDRICTLAVQAGRCEIIDLDSENPRKKLLVDRLKNETREITLDPPPRRHLVDRLSTLVDLAAEAKGEYDDGTAEPVFWLSDDAVVLHYDDHRRLDVAVMYLSLSDAARFLTDLAASGKPGCAVQRLDQRELIQRLRFTLGVDDATITKFRYLVWSLSEQTTSVKNTRDARLGADIAAKAAGVEELPDALAVSIPWYDGADWIGDRYTIRLGIEIDTQNRAFEILPLPGEMDRVQHLATQRVTDLLIASDVVPVRLGSPQ